MSSLPGRSARATVLLKLALILAPALAIRPTPALACTVCNCRDNTLTANGVEKPYKNRVRLSLEERLGSFTAGEGPALEKALYLRTVLAASWSPTERLTLALVLPWVTTWRTIGQGQNQTINGLGDAELSARVVLFRERAMAPRHLVWGSLGLKLPTGYRLLDDAGVPYSDQDQPGSGSWDPFAGLTYGWFGDRLAAFTSVSYRQTTPNPRGYWRGSSLMAGAAFQVSFVSWAALQAAADVTWMPPDRLSTGYLAPDSGGATVHLAPSLLLQPGSDFLIKLTASVPVVHAMNGNQDAGTQFIATIAWDVR